MARRLKQKGGRLSKQRNIIRSGSCLFLFSSFAVMKDVINRSNGLEYPTLWRKEECFLQEDGHSYLVESNQASYIMNLKSILKRLSRYVQLHLKSEF